MQKINAVRKDSPIVYNSRMTFDKNVCLTNCITSPFKSLMSGTCDNVMIGLNDDSYVYNIQLNVLDSIRDTCLISNDKIEINKFIQYVRCDGVIVVYDMKNNGLFKNCTVIQEEEVISGESIDSDGSAIESTRIEIKSTITPVGVNNVILYELMSHTTEYVNINSFSLKDGDNEISINGGLTCDVFYNSENQDKITLLEEKICILEAENAELTSLVTTMVLM